MQIVRIYPKTAFPLSPQWCMISLWRVPVVHGAINQTGNSTHISALSYICTITETQHNNCNNNTITTAISSSTVSNANSIFNNAANVHTTLPIILRYCKRELHLQQRKTCIPPFPSSRDIVWVREGFRWQKRSLRVFSRRDTLLKYHIMQEVDAKQWRAASSWDGWIIAREGHLSNSHQPIRH